MTSVSAVLRERIAAEGPLSVAAYMDICLAHPEHGYYRRKDPLGAQGDFVTAPEISQMFGEMIGMWCLLTWQKLGMPDPVIVAEVGPGRGTLMADALRAATVMPNFIKAAQLHLIETNPVLQEAQRAKLGLYSPVWHDRIATLPEVPLLLVGNEFLDVLPIRQFEKKEGRWHERLVDWDDTAGEFRFMTGVAVEPPFSPTMCVQAQTAANGVVAETCEAAVAFVTELSKRLTRTKGNALLIDYGSVRSSLGDSLQAVQKHAYHAVLGDPGEADLTAHVDFETLREVACSNRLMTDGPFFMGEWLSAMGMAVRAEQLALHASPAQRGAIETAYHRLTHPEQMGHLFKVLAITSPLSK